MWLVFVNNKVSAYIRRENNVDGNASLQNINGMGGKLAMRRIVTETTLYLQDLTSKSICGNKKKKKKIL